MEGWLVLVEQARWEDGRMRILVDGSTKSFCDTVSLMSVAMAIFLCHRYV